MFRISSLSLGQLPVLICAAILALGLPVTAHADEYVLHAFPAVYNITLNPNDTLMLEALVVYEESGAAANFVTNNREPWLYLDTIPASPLVTPESIFVFVTAPPSPGAYVDTITIWADSTQNSPLRIPVNLMVEGEGPGDFLVLASPSVLNLTVAPGEMGFALVDISEYYGRNVPFEVWNVSPWLTYSAYPQVPPYFTPTTLEVVAISEGLEPGTYYDTLRIRQAVDSLPFPRTTVVVDFTIAEPDTVPRLSVYPTSYTFTVAPGDSNFYASVNVSEVSGDSISFSCFNYTSWLVFDTLDITPLVTPEMVPFMLNISGLTPGFYQDSIVVVTYVGGFQRLTVPILLEVTGSGEYQLATLPTSLEFNLSLGQLGFDSLHVYEVGDNSVNFFFDWNAGWLVVEPLGLGPYYTPMTLGVTANSNQIGPGTFYGAITIYSNAPPYDSVMVPVTLNVGPLTPVVSTAPDDFELTVTPGSNIENLGLVVYEQYGFSLPFWVETAHNSDWLQIHFPEVEYPDWFTPDSVYFDLLTAGLDPGVYADSLIIFDPLDDTLTFANVYVPVTVTVLGDEPYQVETAPPALYFTASPGVPLYDSLHVFETGGRNVGFQFTSSAPWLLVEPFGMPPYMTPYSLVVTVTEDTLPVGIYIDTILITSVTDTLAFIPVAVPVTFVVQYDTTQMVCGDADGDGFTNISDAVLMINYIFAGAQIETELCVCDVNSDEIVNITDIVFLIYYIFRLAFTEPQCCP
ncbi:MAG: dockerin type I repeat-containing protein [bacterium]